MDYNALITCIWECWRRLTKRRGECTWRSCRSKSYKPWDMNIIINSTKCWHFLMTFLEWKQTNLKIISQWKLQWKLISETNWNQFSSEGKFCILFWSCSKLNLIHLFPNFKSSFLGKPTSSEFKIRSVEFDRRPSCRSYILHVEFGIR